MGGEGHDHEVEYKQTYDPNRWMAVCKCGWTTVTTGPQAEERIRKRLCPFDKQHRQRRPEV